MLGTRAPESGRALGSGCLGAGHDSPGLERLRDDRCGDAVAGRGLGAVHTTAHDAQTQTANRGIAARVGRGVGEQQEPALGTGDVDDRAEDLLEHLAQHERRVECLHEREQELLLLDPGQLAHRPGDRLGPEQGVLQGQVAQLDLGPRGQLGPGHLRGVHVDAVTASGVLHEEAAVLVVEPRVRLRDRALVEDDVVVAGTANRVGPGAKEANRVAHVSADHLDDCDRERVAASLTARGLRRVLGRALRAVHRAGS